MKIRTFFLFAGLIVAGLLLTDPASAQWTGVNQSMPHFGKDNVCSDHMVNPTALGTTTPQYFYLCALQSGATSWSFTIVRNSVPPVTVCSMSNTTVVSPLTKSCNISTAGSYSYKGTIAYYIGGSPFAGHADYWWTIP